jgi:hypothetical protein
VNVRIKVGIGAVVLVLGALAYAKLDDHGEARLIRTRRSLAAHGFATNLGGLRLTSAPELTARGQVMLLAAAAARDVFPTRELAVMRPVTEQSARVISKEQKPLGDSTIDLWGLARTNFGGPKEIFDKACAALGEGTFRIEATNYATATEIRYLAAAISGRLALALHDGEHAEAWSNLLASVRLGSQWDVEPSELSCVMRFFVITSAQRATWEALQWPIWTEQDLAMLQQEWTKIETFRGLPETAKMAMAAASEMFEYRRRQPPSPPVPLTQIGSDFLTSPRSAWLELTARRANPAVEASYRREAEYLSLYERRFAELSQLSPAQTWKGIRALPGITNVPPVGPPGFTMGTDFPVASTAGSFAVRPDQAGIIGRAALAETRRRLALTALAMRRFELSHSRLPEALSELTPALLQSSLLYIDFMDGQPLRYKVSGANQFLLYSVGLDCKDDGGKIAMPDPQRIGFGGGNSRGGFFRQDGPDVLWPLPEDQHTNQIKSF